LWWYLTVQHIPFFTKVINLSDRSTILLTYSHILINPIEMKNQLIIVVRGGVVDEILTNNTNNLTEVILVDWDNIEGGGGMETQLPTYISDFEDYKTRLEKDVFYLHSKNQEPVTKVDSLIGKTVKVISATDETIDSTRIGLTGVVTYLNTNGQTGNTENDPLWGVKFPDGVVEYFWTEELSVVHNF